MKFDKLTRADLPSIVEEIKHAVMSKTGRTDILRVEDLVEDAVDQSLPEMNKAGARIHKILENLGAKMEDVLISGVTWSLIWGIAASIIGERPNTAAILSDEGRVSRVVQSPTPATRILVLRSFASEEEANYARRRGEDIVPIDDVASWKPKQATVIIDYLQAIIVGARVPETEVEQAVIFHTLPRGVTFG